MVAGEAKAPFLPCVEVPESKQLPAGGEEAPGNPRKE